MRHLLIATVLIGAALTAPDKRCGLPPNHASLPEFAREELQAIWKDYVQGAPCQKEIQLTDEILKVLDEFGDDFESDTAVAFKSFSGNDSSENGSAPAADGDAAGPAAAAAAAAATTPHPTLNPIVPERVVPERVERSRQSAVAPAALRPRKLRTSTWAPRFEPSSTPNYRRIASSSIAPVDEYYDYHDPAPTQGKVAKSLKQIGSPAFKDYGDIELLRDRRRKILDENGVNFFKTTTRKPQPQVLSRRKAHATSTHQFHDYDFKLNDYTDDFNVHFDTPNAPFLKNVPPKVREEFERLWSNEDVPSEALRAQKVHLLAVSLLSGNQLEEYNTWATNRKKALRAREEEMSRLSPKARAALRRIARDDAQSEMRLSPSVKSELMKFARRIETRRLRRSRARRS